MRALLTALAVLTLLPAAARAADGQKTDPPRTWVDKDTGHRVWRLSDEPNSGGFYFNINAYTPDGKSMIYTAPDGIHVFDLGTRKTRLLAPNPPQPANLPPSPGGPMRFGVHALVAGFKTNSVFYTQTNPATKVTTVYKADVATGQIRKLVDLPDKLTIATVNADETLAAGTYIEGDATGKEFGSNMPAPPQLQSSADNRGASQEQGPHYQPLDKGQMMERRLAARLPIVLFTIRLEPGPNGEKPGDIKILLHSTDWVNHLLFSPTDPELLMYCHEGPWQKVDRIWTIHTDGTHNTLIHKRTMANEIAGHEFWGLDGETIWYDWQYPKGEVFYLAGYNLSTGARTAYHMERNDWSIHFNLTRDLDVFCGDGGDPGQVAHAPDGEWIELFHSQLLSISANTLNAPDFWQPGVFHSEHLVNMSRHNYREEPNVRFSPDRKLVFFTSNMFGPSYVFGVEVAKAVDPPAANIQSTPDLARRFNLTGPAPAH
ncbi:MAG: oligogalacturonate lyase family protein [Terracidiphilus sp.]